MKLKNLQIENIRSYENLDISFDDGVTVVSGNNGSGKSSLLEACFIALFGSRALTKDYVIGDMIRKGSSKASINLEFEYDGNIFEIEQAFRISSKTGRATSTRSVVRSADEIIADQATQTYEFVCNMLGMDEEAYRNCVYIRQGEIDVLINARSQDRQRMIDDLLQIGRLEEYQERSVSARTGIGRHQRYADQKIRDIKSEIETIRSQDPYDTLSALKEESKKLQLKISQLQEKRNKALVKINSLETDIREYDKVMDDLSSLKGQQKKLMDRKASLYQSIESSRDKIRSYKRAVNELEAENRELKTNLGISANSEDMGTVVSEIETFERNISDKINGLDHETSSLEKEMKQKKELLESLEKQLDSKSRKITELKRHLDSKSREIEDLERSVNQMEQKKNDTVAEARDLGFSPEKLEDIDEIMGLLRDQQKRLHGNESGIKTRLEELNKKIQTNREMLEKGICPTCGQDLEGSPVSKEENEDLTKVKEYSSELLDLERKQKEIEERIKKVDLARKLDRKLQEYTYQKQIAETNIQSNTKVIDDYKKQILELEGEIVSSKDQKEEVIKALDSLSASSRSLNSRNMDLKTEHSKVQKKLDGIRHIMKNTNKIQEHLNKAEQLENGIRSDQDKVQMLEENISDLQRRISELRKKLEAENIDEMKNNYSLYRKAYGNMGNDIEKLNEKMNELSRQEGKLEADISRLSVLEKDLHLMINQKKYLERVYEEGRSLEEMYKRLRTELRLKNIDALDGLMNEIFSFMYTNNAYARIELDHDYNFTVYEKDGTPLEPKLLSGGERAIFNLVLRCAIYRLMSMGRGNDSIDLPPLIMDEPTVFLDRGHIHQLIKLIDMMRNVGVGQILIVSHDESLIDSADLVFSVEKDPVTNISFISAE